MPEPEIYPPSTTLDNTPALKDKRSEEISAYLQDNSDRVFNSLVVAVYDEKPNWHPLSDVNSRYGAETTLKLSDETIESVGFLTLEAMKSCSCWTDSTAWPASSERSVAV